MTQAAIAVRQLKQGYGRKCVLENLSLEIPKGQTFALLGRNGAGKTTLLRTLLGLLPPMSGTVEVLGMSPASQAVKIRQRIGYLAEDQSMYGWMTAAEIMKFLSPFYPKWDNTLANDLVDQFGVPRDVRIKRLSKGQGVRLGLAMALAHRPELVILDDPALGLDPITRKQFNRDVISHLQSQGHTVLYSSHLLYEVEAVADAVAILDEGRIVRTGSTEALHRDVKQVRLATDALRMQARPAKLLDVQIDGHRAAVTVDHAGEWISHLEANGVEHIVEDLSLDEIFEAFVIGRTDAWPGRGVELQPAMA
jgi:ABC-2 type transport system ATP-binding protein